MASAPLVIGGSGGDPDLNAILSVAEGALLAKCMRRSFRAHEHASVCTQKCHGPVLHGLKGCACFVAGQEVVLDKATADQIKKASPPPKSFKIEEIAAFRRAHSISKEFCQPLSRSQVCRLSWMKSANIIQTLDVHQPRSAKGCLICIPEVAAPATLASHCTLHLRQYPMPANAGEGSFAGASAAAGQWQQRGAAASGGGTCGGPQQQ